MRFSPIAVFKTVVIILFVAIVMLCAFRNYPQSETLTLIHTSNQASSALNTDSSESPPQTTQTKTVTSVYSEPEDIQPTESRAESEVLPQTDAPVETSIDEPQTSAQQTDYLIIEQKPYSSSVQTIAQTTQNDRLININTATAAQLKTLTGIGDVKAQAIVEYRELHGNFATIEDLTRVNGIGEKTLEKIRNDITV